MIVPTLDDVLHEARQRLRAAPFEPSTREATLLLGYVLGYSEAQVLARGREPLESSSQDRYERLLRRRLAGEPIAYLRGEREFYGRPFGVDSRVLIPRPETEHLIEAALASPLPTAARVVDLGTGSGCIALTLALERPAWRLLATDRSHDALQVAQANRRRLDDGSLARRVALVCADWHRGLDLRGVHLLVSNPPYVAPEMRNSLSTEVVDHEPHAALFARRSGRQALDQLIGAARALPADGRLIVEIGHDQAEWITDRLGNEPTLHLAQLIRDYSGIPRTAVIQRVA